MKDKKLRLYIRNVLFAGLCLVVLFAVLWLIFGGVFDKLALGTLIILPLFRIVTEIYGFSKEGEPRFALISAIMLAILLAEYFILA
ncbi:putative membrane protein [Elusimicrobium posterum]|uniref:hypothetical protein n=1 Tax=Elusimicrobium posterum TaxID=3116653 RepID=UPI003C77CF13